MDRWPVLASPTNKTMLTPIKSSAVPIAAMRKNKGFLWFG